ncbi:MAG: DNA-binding protein [Candidatus Electrothrix sp. EH2]|nr:DNA-binding protein [Candidatus Electrothrix sp. EH2]
MPSLTIKNIPSDLYNDLQRAAAQHRKTISSHIVDCLKAVMHQGTVAEQNLKRIQQIRSEIASDPVTEKEIEQAINEGRP